MSTPYPSAARVAATSEKPSAGHLFVSHLAPGAMAMTFLPDRAPSSKRISAFRLARGVGTSLVDTSGTAAPSAAISSRYLSVMGNGFL